MRSKFILIVIAIVLVSTLVMLPVVGCKAETVVDESAEEVETTSEEAAPEEAEETEAMGEQWFVEMTEKYKGETINVLTTTGFGFVEALQLDGEEFEKLTGVKVEVSDLPWDGLHDKVMANFIGKSPDYDVVNMDGWAVPAIFNAGAVINLQPIIDEGTLVYPDWDINDFIERDFEFNGTWPAGEDIFAIPYFPDVIMLFYNKSYFEQNDIQPPTTWDEFKAIGEKLNGKDLNDDGKSDWGFGMFSKRTRDIQTLWHDRFISFGEETAYFDDDYKPLLNTDAAVKGLDLLIEHTKISPVSLDWDYTMTNEAFVLGDIAMCEAWTNIPSLADDQSKSNIVGQWDATVIPMGDKSAPQYGGWSLGIPTYSEKQELAFLFIQWATTKEMMKKVVLEKSLPQSRYSVLLDPEVLDVFPWYEQLVAGLDTGVGVPKIPEVMEILSMMEVHLSNAVIGATTSQEALDLLQEEVTDFMEERGYYE